MTEPTSGYSMLEARQLERAADVLKAVAHPMRLQIIDILERGERTVTELCQILGAQQPHTSQQLNLMKSKGILASRRAGHQVYYVIANPSVVKIIHCVRQGAAVHCAGAADLDPVMALSDHGDDQ